MTTAVDPRPPLSCAEIIRLVSEYFDEALSPADRIRFEAHIADCPGCSAYLAQWRVVLRLTGRLVEDDVDDAAKQRLMEAFRGWQNAPPPRRSFLSKLRQLFHR